MGQDKVLEKKERLGLTELLEYVILDLSKERMVKTNDAKRKK